MADRTSLENDAVDNGALWSREEELSLLVDMVPSHLWRLTDEGEPSFSISVWSISLVSALMT